MTNRSRTEESPSELATRVRDACIQAAKDGYEDAAMAGLCGEGALEVAISHMESLNVEALARDEHDPKQPDSSST